METTADSKLRNKASLLRVICVVLSGFAGIGKRGGREKIEVTPVQVIIVGIMAGMIFVGTVVSVVRFVTH